MKQDPEQAYWSSLRREFERSADLSVITSRIEMGQGTPMGVMVFYPMTINPTLDVEGTAEEIEARIRAHFTSKVYNFLGAKVPERFKSVRPHISDRTIILIFKGDWQPDESWAEREIGQALNLPILATAT